MSKKQWDDRRAELVNQRQICVDSWGEGTNYERVQKQERLTTLDSLIEEADRHLDAERIHPYNREAWDSLVFQDINDRLNESIEELEAPLWVEAKDVFYRTGNIQPLLDLAKSVGWEYADVFEVKRVKLPVPA